MQCIIKNSLKAVVLAGAFVTTVYAACPAVTVKDNRGFKGDAAHNIFGLQEFQNKARCTLTFRENPNIKALNARIKGNKALSPVADRLPAEPMVVAPYDSIGTYGGTLTGISNATESGTSENIAYRHVNLVRLADDFNTVVPYVAKAVSVSADSTEFTFTLRKGHKWSDGMPFTAYDVEFWFNDLVSNKNIMKKMKNTWKSGDTPMVVKAIDEVTVVFKMASPRPLFLQELAVTAYQAFQPKHFFAQFHPDYNPRANQIAQQAGFKDGYEVINFYYGASDWKDVPSPYLKDPTLAKVNALPGKRAVVPTLESHLVVEDSKDGRRVVANPYFFVVDTQGNQLPYIDEIKEIYIKDNEVTVLKMVNGDIDIKHQNLNLAMAPALLDGADKGVYKVYFLNRANHYAFAPNVTHKDPEIRALFEQAAFRKALSIAIDRQEMNEALFFGQGNIVQYTGFSPSASFLDDSLVKNRITYNLAKAKAEFAALGLKDTNGDGFYELPSGNALNLTFVFQPQAFPPKGAELLVQALNDAGFKTGIREVTTDEHRNAMSANDLDFLVGGRGNVAYRLNATDFRPPFSGFFGTPNGVSWGQYLDTNGAEGIKPPTWAYQVMDLQKKFSQYAASTPEYVSYAKQTARLLSDNLPYIGLFQAPVPMYVNNTVKNVPHHILAKGVSPNEPRYSIPFGGYQYYLRR